METIEIFAHALPGVTFELVRDPNRTECLLLHFRRGQKFKTVSEVRHGGKLYVPRALKGSLAEAVRIAPPSVAFGSTSSLISSVRNFIATHLSPSPETMVLLIAFVLASWFCDAMHMAPLLYLFGPEAEVSQALRLLSYVCRRAVLLGDVNVTALAALPIGLCPTLLLNQRDRDARVMSCLLASNRRHFQVARAKERMDLYGAKAFACDEYPADQRALKVTLSPARSPLPLLTDAEAQEIARTFQAKFLRYRLRYLKEVRNCSVDSSAFGPEFREQAPIFLASIRGCPEFFEEVSIELLRQSRELAGSRFTDPRCVVAEAALNFCHRSETKHFFVGELAETANVLLTARHEESELSIKKTGLILRGLGISSQRVARGFRVELDQRVRQRIHQVASDYGVLSVDGVRRCQFCTGATEHRTNQ